MQERTRFVGWFRASAPYIHAHRGRTFVVHIDGAAVAAGNFAGVVHDLALMRSLGVRLVVVHGARQQIERSLEQRGFSVRYAQGLRVTEMPALGTVLEAVGATRIAIESLLSMGVANSPMAGAAVRVAGGNFITARPIGVRNGVDFGFSGEVRRIDTDAIAARLAADEVVLLSPVGHSPTGETFNLRSEDLAAAVAIELRAAKLLFLAPDARLVDADGHPARQLSLADARAVQRSLRGDQHATERVVLERAVPACLHGVGRTPVLAPRRPRAQEEAPSSASRTGTAAAATRRTSRPATRTRRCCRATCPGRTPRAADPETRHPSGRRTRVPAW